MDVATRSIRLHLTPLDVSETLSGLIHANGQAWIFTSATLAVGDDFSHFTTRMGLGGAQALALASPYALAEHGLIYLPRDLPEPSDPQHTAVMLENVMALEQAFPALASSESY